MYWLQTRQRPIFPHNQRSPGAAAGCARSWPPRSACAVSVCCRHRDDVEKVGIFSSFWVSFVGIRLKTYDNYLRNLSPDLAKFLKNNFVYAKYIAAYTAVIDVESAIELWSELNSHLPSQSALKESLKKHGEVGELVKVLLWSRSKYGYEIAIGSLDSTMKVNDLKLLVERYWKSAQLPS